MASSSSYRYLDDDDHSSSAPESTTRSAPSSPPPQPQSTTLTPQQRLAQQHRLRRTHHDTDSRTSTSPIRSSVGESKFGTTSAGGRVREPQPGSLSQSASLSTSAASPLLPGRLSSTSSATIGGSPGAPLTTRPPKLSMRPLSRASLQTSRRRRARARWGVLMWLGMLLTFMHRSDEISIATGGLISVQTVAIFTPLSIVGITVNELYDGPHSLVALLTLVVSFAWGALFRELEDMTLARFLCIAWLGGCAGQLRFHWDVRRLSRKIAYHPPLQRVWNFLIRKLGLCTFLFIGETTGCLFLVDKGWSLIPNSIFGYGLVLVLPFITYKLASFVTTIIMALFSRLAARHAKNRTKMQVLQLVLTIGVSLGILFASVMYFLHFYVPFMWQQQLLMAPYGWIFELCSFSFRKQRVMVPIAPSAEGPTAADVTSSRKSTTGNGSFAADGDSMSSPPGVTGSARYNHIRERYDDLVKEVHKQKHQYHL